MPQLWNDTQGKEIHLHSL